MKTLNIVLITGILAVSHSAQANKTTEQQCAKSVQATIEAIEVYSDSTGRKEKLKDLSVTDIRKMEKKIGSCKAMQEINKRTMS